MQHLAAMLKFFGSRSSSSLHYNGITIDVRTYTITFTYTQPGVHALTHIKFYAFSSIIADYFSTLNWAFH